MALNVALAFVLTPLLLRHLGEGRYGSWMLVSSLIGYFGLLELGVGSALFRFVPLYRGQGDSARVGAVVNTALAFYSGVGLLIFLMALLFADAIAAFFAGGPELAALIRLVGLAAVFDLPGIILNTAVKGFEGFVSANLMTALQLIARFLLLVACVLGGFGLVALGWVLVVNRILALALNYFNFRAVCRGVHLSYRLARWSELIPLLSYGGLILVASTANNLAAESPKQIVGKMLSLEMLGLFAIPLLLIGYYRQAVMAITRTFSPRFSMLTGRNETDAVRNLFLLASRYVVIAASGLGLLLLTIGPSFLLIWTGKETLRMMGPPLLVLSAGTLVFVSFRLGGDLLFGLGEQKWVSAFEAVEALAIFSSCILFSHYWGIEGAAFGVAVPPIVVRGFWQTRVISRLLETDFASFPLGTVLVPWTAVIVVAGSFYLLSVPAVINGWLSLFLAAAGVCAVYGSIAFAFALTTEERVVLLHWLRQLLCLGSPDPNLDRIEP